jgi:hypothetical protein
LSAALPAEVAAATLVVADVVAERAMLSAVMRAGAGRTHSSRLLRRRGQRPRARTRTAAAALTRGSGAARRRIVKPLVDGAYQAILRFGLGRRPGTLMV